MRLHVHEYGDPAGPPVVCLHGVTGHGERFRRLGEGGLARRRVIAPDLRGHGRSGYDPPWDAYTHAADALETARSMGIDRADWIGFSYGGRVAAALAASAPERVRRLVLLDPALTMPPEVSQEQAHEELSDLSFADADEAIEERLASGTLFHTPREMLEEEMRDHLVRGEDGRLRPRYDRAAVIAIWGDMAGEPPPVADVPTLVLTGDRSWVPVDLSRYPKAQTGAISGGHSLLWEDLDATAAAVEAFLAD
jgi:lipase